MFKLDPKKRRGQQIRINCHNEFTPTRLSHNSSDFNQKDFFNKCFVTLIYINSMTIMTADVNSMSVD